MHSDHVCAVIKEEVTVTRVTKLPRQALLAVWMFGSLLKGMLAVL